MPSDAPRYSTLAGPKMCDLAAAVMKQGCNAHDFMVMVWDPDAEEECPITGFVIYPDKKIISLRSDED